MAVRNLCLVLGDQLSKSVSSLADYDASKDVVVMAEIWDETQYVKHHKKKIAFIFAAMRHFADQLSKDGLHVDYHTLDPAHELRSFTDVIKSAIKKHKPERIIVTHPGEYRVLQICESWKTDLPIPVEIRHDDRFFCSPHEFSQWSKGKSQLRMEFFYRLMRQKHKILLDENGKPEGGAWNYDADNRNPPPKKHIFPRRPVTAPDPVTQEVIDLVDQTFSDHFGDTLPFTYAVTAADAQTHFQSFIEKRLPYFGTYQDAMLNDEPYLYHSHIGQYLNVGLLDPLDCCRQAEQAYRDGRAPLPAVEGFIRQILGWREYIRGIYWLKMPDYKERNHLQANRQLPWFYWSGDTRMQCMRQCVKQTREHAYAHHIQRLMITGNFALLAGIHPDDVNEWYMIVYTDAFEWVELPNVTGMILYADGGYLASKPYAASGKYINRMSDYCKHCHYDVNQSVGENACPFNYLYWNFIFQHTETLSRNHRMQLILGQARKMPAAQQDAIRTQAKAFLDEWAPIKT